LSNIRAFYSSQGLNRAGIMKPYELKEVATVISCSICRQQGTTVIEAKNRSNGKEEMPIEDVRIVLVCPQGLMNVGSVARAMKNMGFRELALVDPAASPMHADALVMAVRARDVLEHALIFPHLADAVADCTWVIGTTRRRGKGRGGGIDPRQMGAEIADRAPRNKVAVVFGPEDRGLTNRDLDLCHRLVTIPAHEEYGSLNLAQAVMIVCYEIYLAVHHGETASRSSRLATSQELEGMYEHMEETLLRVGFLDQNNPKRMMAVLRRIFSKAQLDSREVRVLRGICRQANWYAGQRLEK
jgi:tRNA/rRNA methyltransferase